MKALLLLAALASAETLDFWRIDKGYGQTLWARGTLGREELVAVRPRGARGGRDFSRGGKTVLVKRMEGKAWRYEDADGNVLLSVKPVEGGAEYFGRDGALVLRRLEREPGLVFFTDSERKALCAHEDGRFTFGKRDRRPAAESQPIKYLDGEERPFWTVSEAEPLRKAARLLFPALPLGAHHVPHEAWFVVLMSDELGSTASAAAP